MSELTDLEICKKIAEIEGLELDNECELEEDFYLMSSAPKWIIDSSGFDERCISFTFNPLTDKALCFDLMVKHEINIKLASCISKGEWVAKWDYTMDIDGGIAYADTPQRAICLAIIAKHEESKCQS